MAPKSNDLLPESLRARPNQIARLVSWIHGRPLMKSFHDEGHQSLLKLCRDLCLTQGTEFVLPVLEQVVDTSSMVLVCTTEFKK